MTEFNHWQSSLASTSTVHQHEFNQDTLQQRLQKLIDTARESWTYAIFWKSSVLEYSGPPVLGWGNGYYKGEQNKPKTVMSATSLAEQEYRKKVLRELNSMISGTQSPENDAVDEEVPDTEWFFLLSMTHSFVNGVGLPGHAMVTNQPVWIAGVERLMTSHCERARQGQSFGLQTIVCIPSADGVIELGSTELIYQSWDIMKKVRGSFNFNDQVGQGSSYNNGNLSHVVGGVSGQAPSISDMARGNMSSGGSHSYSSDHSAPSWNALYIRDSSPMMIDSDNVQQFVGGEFESQNSIQEGNSSQEVGGVVRGQPPSISDMARGNMSSGGTHSYSRDHSAPSWNALYIRDSSPMMIDSVSVQQSVGSEFGRNDFSEVSSKA